MTTCEVVNHRGAVQVRCHPQNDADKGGRSELVPHEVVKQQGAVQVRCRPQNDVDRDRRSELVPYEAVNHQDAVQVQSRPQIDVDMGDRMYAACLVSARLSKFADTKAQCARLPHI